MNGKWLAGLLGGVLAGAVVFSVTSALLAQNTGMRISGQVACVDVVKAFNEYQRQKDLNEEMKQLQQELQQEDEQRRQKIDELQATVQAMDEQDPAYVQRMQEWFELQVEYKTWGELKQAHLTREVGLWSGKMYQEIVQATAAIAQNDGYTLVLYRDEFQLVADPQAVQEQIRMRKLLYAHPSLDITQAVLDKLNADYRAQAQQKMLRIP
ncbi:MAG: OmpH family outer membrane protein [Planctomycetes bacterium]|nr:OmpH family outer membrane protein [Planctomycetota bacterium]